MGIKERPILFNSDMVNAILSGRKTQTRRIVKPQPCGLSTGAMGPNQYRDHAQFYYDAMSDRGGNRFETDRVKTPYGKPGDQLWVRETWGVVSHAFNVNGDRQEWKPDRPATPVNEMRFGKGYYHGHVIYAADGGFEWAGDDDGGGDRRSAWKPSIHMPRIASRITLEIVSVRVERLQNISPRDAEAEGCECGSYGKYYPVDNFAYLWESINGRESWEANPWVWVVEFKVVG